MLQREMLHHRQHEQVTRYRQLLAETDRSLQAMVFPAAVETRLSSLMRCRLSGLRAAGLGRATSWRLRLAGRSRQRLSQGLTRRLSWLCLPVKARDAVRDG
jgi:hypothetical protein